MNQRFYRWIVLVLEKCKGWVALARPLNVTITALSIAVAALISGGSDAIASMLLACLAGAWITVAANAINDYFDIEIDRINKPHRPLASGLLSRKTALFIAAGSATIGFLFSVLINPATALMAGVAIVLLYFYSAWFKGTVVFGNLTVSLMTGLAFLFGSAAVGHFSAGWIPAVFAFLMHFGREIIKDMQDVRGDSRHHADTLPVKYGLRPARILVTTIFIVLIAATWLPFHAGWYGRWYAGIVMLGIYPVLLSSIWIIWRHSEESVLGRLSGLLKADMVVGLLAIAVGRW